MPLPREFTGTLPTGASYEEGAPQSLPGPTALSMQSADADRQMRRRAFRQQQQGVLEALVRYRDAAKYSAALGGSANGDPNYRPLTESLQPWETELLQNIAPTNSDAPWLKNTAYAFDASQLHPGDRDLVLRELMRRQKRRR